MRIDTIDVRKLGADDATALMALRREALENEPFAFAASVADDVGLIRESVLAFLEATDVQAVFGAFEDAALAGMVGLVRATKLKQRHKATVWGMYVRPASRGKGIG